MFDDKIKYHEQYVCNSLNKLIKKQYTLKNPVLHEYCIFDCVKEFHRQLSAENNECIKELEESLLYKLILDNDYFDENIDISDNMNILPIRMKKIIDDENDDDNKPQSSHISNKIKIIEIEMNNHYGYILYETHS